MRASGPRALSIAESVFRGESLRDRVASYGSVVDPAGSVIDKGIALFFAGPRSYTGEDVVEFQVHGSTIVARDVLTALLAAGARLAHPGEFTRRAFENGKIELCEAEAIGALIAAEGRAAARAAAAGLTGGLRREVERMRARLSEIVEELAAALDFPDEVPPPAGLAERVGSVAAAATALAGDYEQGRQVREGTWVAIVGPPNAGKSSLLNALLGSERALVSASPGTTRDTIDETLALDGLRLRIVDTAGLRSSSDPVEQAGIRRSEEALAGAHVALVVVDGAIPLSAEARAVLSRTRGRERVVFFNKRDLGTAGYAQREEPEREALCGSAHDPAAVAMLGHALTALVRGSESAGQAHPHLMTARQAAAAIEAARLLHAAAEGLDRGDPADLCIADLVGASAALGEVTGRDAGEAILDGVFARFCIGK